jgi:septal ring factor EnvC (AmiA/AmiB activator)
MQNVPQQPRPPVQQPQQSPLAGARKAVGDAEVALLQAKRDQQKVVSGVQAWFAQKPDFMAAAAKIKKAQADLDAAEKPIKDAVESSQTYQDLAAQRAEARKTLDAGSNPNSGVSQADLDHAADTMIKTSLAMTSMEKDALDNDAKVAAARDELTEARNEMAALQQQVTDALATNPDYIASQKVVQEKQDDLQNAQNNLAQQEQSNRPKS